MTPTERIDRLIDGLTDWRGETLAKLRKTILAADREIVEEWKWMGSPVWEREGIIAVGNAHKNKVKLTFSHGASLDDPDKLFNAGFGGNVWRAIDLYEGDKIDARVTSIDSKTRRINVSIKAREVAEEKEAVEQFGSADSGASLGDILGAALKGADKED